MLKAMSRPASGDEVILVKAREAIANARTVEQLPQAQEVVLPPGYRLSCMTRPRSLTRHGAVCTGELAKALESSNLTPIQGLHHIETLDYRGYYYFIYELKIR